MRQEVTAVIPVFNGRELLRKLLASIFAQTVPFQEVIVVDNGSSDGARELAQEFGCRVISMGYNAGFAKAVNRGTQEAGTGWVAILNSDVELAADWVEQCLRVEPQGSFVTGKLLKSSDTAILDGTYDLLSRSGCAWRAGHGQPDGGDCEPVRIFLAPGTACIFQRDVLASLGSFDETFESYLEDVDLGLRCVRAGFWGFYVPRARATHAGSATFGAWNARVVRLISRNQLLLIAKHYDSRLFRRWWWPILVGQMLWGLLAVRHGAGIAWLRGKWEALRGFRFTGEASREIEEFIRSSEAEIRSRAGGAYWRWYFRLTAAH